MHDGEIFMPITLDKKLPAVDISFRKYFLLWMMFDNSPDIRPMILLVFWIMPTKEATETQLLRLLANTPLQNNVDFLYMASHKSGVTRKGRAYGELYKTLRISWIITMTAFDCTGRLSKRWTWAGEADPGLEWAIQPHYGSLVWTLPWIQ